MIPLTPEQQRGLDESEVRLRVVDPRTNTTYVLVRADDYELMRKWFDGFAHSSGWDDPALDVYEQYRDQA
jgi:hypothetical protein